MNKLIMPVMARGSYKRSTLKKDYNWGGCQIGNDKVKVEEESSLEYSVVWISCGVETFAMKWFIENPAQHEQIQNGVQASWFCLLEVWEELMPHNLYLHSSIVQTRNYPRTTAGKKKAIKFATIDSTASLLIAFFINAAILIVAAASFHTSGHQNVSDIWDAHKLLAPLLGTTLASTFFAVALLASGQNSTLTGTLAGQIVMEGFLNIRLRPWLRRLITRSIAIIPAFIVTVIYGSRGTANLLVLSQVILSMQLSFAVVPLVLFTNSKSKMGQFANKPFLKTLVWIISIIIICLNVYLLFGTFFS